MFIAENVYITSTIKIGQKQFLHTFKHIMQRTWTTGRIYCIVRQIKYMGGRCL